MRASLGCLYSVQSAGPYNCGAWPGSLAATAVRRTYASQRTDDQLATVQLIMCPLATAAVLGDQSRTQPPLWSSNQGVLLVQGSSLEAWGHCSCLHAARPACAVRCVVPWCSSSRAGPAGRCSAVWPAAAMTWQIFGQGAGHLGKGASRRLLQDLTVVGNVSITAGPAASQVAHH